ncbi:hypothetical protein HDU79_009908 [Rhizoclosmatium sp. JEL0117]|nr:hypothetical protein HDU99_004515 [Rhizoclosmatium hyalinum]KAJ3295072.1 hypothetical protein HDU79_009908 [Rhizoclosmatium sp. JEL0117]
MPPPADLTFTLAPPTLLATSGLFSDKLLNEALSGVAALLCVLLVLALSITLAIVHGYLSEMLYPRPTHWLVAESLAPDILLATAFHSPKLGEQRFPDQTSCAICLDPLQGKRRKPVESTNCGHSFHMICISRWLEVSRKPLCPLCHVPFTVNPAA